MPCKATSSRHVSSKNVLKALPTQIRFDVFGHCNLHPGNCIVVVNLTCVPNAEERTTRTSEVATSAAGSTIRYRGTIKL